MAKRIALAVGLTLSALALTVLANMRSGDPALFPVRSGDTAIPVYVVSHGYHSGLVLRRADLLRAATTRNQPLMRGILERFGLYDYLEFGWGDEGFYHHVRSLTDLRIAEALRALFLPGNHSVMHVVGLYEGPRQSFRSADIMFLRMTEAGFSRLSTRLDESFAGDGQHHAEEMGEGLYGPSLFYRANGTFSLFNVCNHWVAHLLDSAGVPTNPFLSTLPNGLLFRSRVARPCANAAASLKRRRRKLHTAWVQLPVKAGLSV